MVNNDHTLNKNALNGKKWKSIILQRASKAYGAKWYKWYVGQRLWQQSKSKVIPEEYRKYTLIEFGSQGD